MDKSCDYLKYLTRDGDLNYLFNDYIDGNLSKKDNEIIKSHIESCDKCFQEINSLKETIQQIKTLKDAKFPEPSEAYYINLLDNIKSDQKVIKLTPLSKAKYAVAGFIVIAISAIILMNTPHSTKEMAKNNDDTEQFTSYYENILEDNDTSVIAESGLPTDEWGLIDLNGY